MDEQELSDESRRILRLAAEIAAEMPMDTQEQRVGLIAYAYARGNRDGYAEGAAAAERAFAAVNADIKKALQR